MPGPSCAHTFDGAHKVDRTRRTRIADQGLEAHDHTREAVDPKAEGRPRRVAGGRHSAGPDRLRCLQHRLAFHHGRARPPTVAGPAVADAQFGPTQPVPVLLEGPAAQLNRQGPRLVAALRIRARTRVLSAWETGTASARLRPTPAAEAVLGRVGGWPTRGARPEEPLPTRTPATDPRTPVPVH